MEEVGESERKEESEKREKESETLIPWTYKETIRPLIIRPQIVKTHVHIYDKANLP